MKQRFSKTRYAKSYRPQRPTPVWDTVAGTLFTSKKQRGTEHTMALQDHESRGFGRDEYRGFGSDEATAILLRIKYFRRTTNAYKQKSSIPIGKQRNVYVI